MTEGGGGAKRDCGSCTIASIAECQLPCCSDRARVLHRGAGASAGPPRTPAIFNTDQGSQFTSTAFTAVLLREKIAISIDGKGCWHDNVFLERLRRW